MHRKMSGWLTISHWGNRELCLCSHGLGYSWLWLGVSCLCLGTLSMNKWSWTGQDCSIPGCLYPLLQPSLWGQSQLLFPYSRWGIRSERKINLPRATQLFSGRMRIRTQVLWVSFKCSFHYVPLPAKHITPDVEDKNDHKAARSGAGGWAMSPFLLLWPWAIHFCPLNLHAFGCQTEATICV